MTCSSLPPFPPPTGTLSHQTDAVGEGKDIIQSVPPRWRGDIFSFQPNGCCWREESKIDLNFEQIERAVDIIAKYAREYNVIS